MRQPVGSEKVGEACGRRSSDEHLVLAVERGGGIFPSLLPQSSLSTTAILMRA